MKFVSEDLKKALKTNGRQQTAQVFYTINGETKELNENDLNSITISYEGNLLKSVMKECVIDSNVLISVGKVITVTWSTIVEEEEGEKFYEGINYGEFIVKETEKNEDTGSYTLTCYDKMLYSMVDYAGVDVTYPITIRSYLIAIANKLGLGFKNSRETFCNYDKTIPYELYLDADGNSLGYTYRDVLDELAEVTASAICINDKEMLEVRYINDTGVTINEEYIKDINVTFGEKYGKINSIVLSRSADSDNVYLKNVASVNSDGLCELKISDNQIMNFNDRANYLPDLLNYLNGINYYINDFSSTGIMYLELLDQYTVQIGDQKYNCLMLNDEIDITQGLEEQIYTESPDQSQTNYTTADKEDRKINQIYLQVDKQNGTITGLSEQVAEHEKDIAELQISSNEIKSYVETIADTTRTASGYGTVTMDDCMAGELQKMTLRGQVWDYLAPHENLYPNDDLVPYGNDNGEYKMYITNTQEVTDETTGEKEKVVTITTINFKTMGVKAPLRKLNDNVYDYIEYIGFLSSGIDTTGKTDEEIQALKDSYVACKLYRNVGVDSTTGNLYELSATTTQELGLTINLEAGQNVFTFSEFTNGYVGTTFVQENKFTKLFTTVVNISSTIDQLPDKIKLEVKEQALLRDEVTSSIDLGILDDQGYMAFKSNQLTIDSDYFKLNKNGYLTTSSAKIGNWNLTTDGVLYSNSTFDGVSYQSGLTGKTDSQFFLYCGCPEDKPHINDSNAYITRKGLMYAKWFQVNGESGNFEIDFDSGRQALQLSSTRLDFRIDNDSNSLFARFERQTDAFYLYLQNAPIFNIYDNLHTRLLYQIDTDAGNIPDHYFAGEMWVDRDLDGKYYQVAQSGDWNSDSRLKENIKDSVTSALDKINKIRFRQFDWNETTRQYGTHIDIGVIAQEVIDIDKNYVGTTKRIYNDEEQELYTINGLNMVTTALKGIQELVKINNDLKAEIELLKDRLNKLESGEK